jgi:signal transduction histidine kinase
MQVALNLLSNAIKFTVEGDVTLAVEVIQEEEESKLKISVADTRIGISPENQ